MNFVLASTSRYRAELLSRLGLDFKAVKPLIDEEALKMSLLKEKATPLEIAEKLSHFKGQSVHQLHPTATIISGDQLVQFNGEILGKPGSVENAVHQLKKMQGQSHELITATTIIINSQIHHHNNIASMKMKNLTDQEIQSYVELDLPLDCAGSIKIESHGIGLFEKIDCNDFSAIQGLPLIWISNTLKRNGYELFKK